MNPRPLIFMISPKHLDKVQQLKRDKSRLVAFLKQEQYLNKNYRVLNYEVLVDKDKNRGFVKVIVF